MVIPTIGRKTLTAAIESVLAQTRPVQEVLVVADTADPISLPSDSRVRLLRVGPGAGGNTARNYGIGEASTDLIALLDDDDTWHPKKLAIQLAELPQDLPDSWISTTLVRDTDGAIRPKRNIRDNERLGDYLFTKTRIRGGVGKIHTSTLLFPRALALEFPFQSDLKFHQDIEWLARLSYSNKNFPVYQVSESLTNCGNTPGSVAKKISWLDSAIWAGEYLSSEPRWHGDFLLETTLRFALDQGGVGAALDCFKRSQTQARPGLPAIVASLARLGQSQLRDLRERH